MAVSQNKAVTAQGLVTGAAFLQTAKIALNSNLNALNLLTAGPNGAVIYQVTALPLVTVTAVQCQLYLSTDGVVLNLRSLLTMPAYTLAPTTSPTESDFGFTESRPLRLAPNQQLWAAIGVSFAGGIMFIAQGEAL